MFQADATIAWVDGNGRAQAQDYYLSGYVQVFCLYEWISETVHAFLIHIHALCSVVVVKGRVLIQ